MATRGRGRERISLERTCASENLFLELLKNSLSVYHFCFLSIVKFALDAYLSIDVNYVERIDRLYLAKYLIN